MNPEIAKRAEELNENKKTFSTRMSLKAHQDLEDMAAATGYNKSVLTELAFEFLLKSMQGK